MSEGKERTQRRVYVLPTELVERIVAYQQSLGLSSEVEAARRLLDDALKQRDTFHTITAKLVSKLKETKSIRDAAREVIADHPLVTNISFEERDLSFKLKNGFRVELSDHGKATIFNENENIYDFDDNLEIVPEWASYRHPRPKPPKPKNEQKKRYDDLDDDIPF